MSAVFEKSSCGGAEISNAACGLVPRDGFLVSLIERTHAACHIGWVGGNHVHLTANRGGVQRPHVGAKRGETVGKSVECGVSPDQIGKRGLKLYRDDRGNLVAGETQEGDDARAATQIYCRRTGAGGEIGRQQIGVGSKGQAVVSLDEADVLVDLLQSLVIV